MEVAGEGDGGIFYQMIPVPLVAERNEDHGGSVELLGEGETGRGGMQF